MQLGDYKCPISIRARQVVEQLSMVLNITEPDGIVRLYTTGPEQEGVTSPYVTVDSSADDTLSVVRYLPTAEAQRAVQNNLGIAGDLVVSYDVNHQNGIGDITVVQDTVIHSFVPKDLPPLPKNIIFVIDISGSMSGRKIEQTRDAMLTILDQLREEDMFMIILFESNLKCWPTTYDEYEGETVRTRETTSDPITTIQPPLYPDNPEPIGPARTLLFPPAPALAAAPSAAHHFNRGKRQAPGSNTGVPWSQPKIPPPPPGAYPGQGTTSTTQPPPHPVQGSTAGMVYATVHNIALAKQFAIRNIRASGGTNINAALLEASRILHSQRQTKGNLILFLTDGSPTSGVTDPRNIVENVAKAAQETRDSGQISIYSLAFGFNLNYDLLKMVSLSPEGKVKRIYAENDAAGQLRNFYQEISSPLMYNLDFIPDSNVVDEETITQNKYPTFFEGSEILVMWKIKPELLDINLVLDRKKRSEPESDDEVPRTWVNSAPTTKKPEEVDYVGLLGCGIGLQGYTTEPVEYTTDIEIDPRITLSDEDYKAREIDCLHVDDPEYNNISNSTLAPTEFTERMWANLKIKNLLKVSKLSKSERKKRQAEKRAICLALKYHLVTPVTSLLVIQGPSVPPEPQVGQSRAMCRPTCGVPGPAGRRGEQGSPGDVGELGWPAAQGPPGSRGTAGQSGSPGSRGESGLPGPRGWSGERGLPGSRGVPGISSPSGQGQRGEPAPQAERGQPGFPGRDWFQGEQSERGSRGEPGIRRDVEEDARPGQEGPQGPSVQEERKPPGSAVWSGGPRQLGDRGFPGPNGTPGLRGENERPGNSGSIPHTTITTPRSTTSSANSTITNSMSTSNPTIQNMTASTAPSATTTTTTTRKTTPPKSTTTTTERMPTTTTTVYLEDTENKNNTECRDEICKNPILAGQSNAGSESLEDNHVNQSVHTANTAEPKAVLVSKDNGSVALLNSSLYVIVNVVLLLIVSHYFS